MSNRLRVITSGAALFIAAAAIVLTGVTHAQRTGTSRQGLVNGSVVSKEIQEEYGLLAISAAGAGGSNLTCSASLLTNDWAITAAHCFTAGNLSSPSSVTVTANWNTVQQRQATQIRSFGSSPNWAPWDVALIQMDSRFAVQGTTDGFKQIIWGDGPYTNLNQYPIEMFGRGIYQFAIGSGASATPSAQDGQYRYGNAVIRRVDGSRYWYPNETGQMIAGGDSGGPTFVTLRVGRALTGVHSNCKIQCVPNQLCGTQASPPPGYSPWQWVTSTPECGDAPVEPVWNQISQLISSSRSPEPAAPPSQLIGTFGTTPANYRPVFLYAIANNGNLFWYRQDTNSSKWTGPRGVGNGWQNFTEVIPAGGDSFYALTQDGQLKWYRHDGFNDGSFDWKGPINVGNGWDFPKVFSGSDGIVYAVKSDGTLLWYRHGGYADGGGANTWSGPQVVGSSWSQFKNVFSVGQGIIYAVKPDGQLLWYRHDGYATGESKWTGPMTVGSGWQNFKQIIPVGDGIILGVTDDGRMLWYKHKDYLTGTSEQGVMRPGGNGQRGKLTTGVRISGTPHWDGPVQIGSGWQGYSRLFALIPSAPAGPR
ncbi:MAG TPA: tachylectin-related carbohydrate-binding protein [Pyrinomonadaceae bacterium]